MLDFLRDLAVKVLTMHMHIHTKWLDHFVTVALNSITEMWYGDLTMEQHQTISN